MASSLIFEKFTAIAKTYSTHPAVYFKKDKQWQALAYAELYNAAVKWGNLLYDRGIRESAHIAILLDNSPEWLISFMAIQYLGAIAVPIGIKADPQDIYQIILHSESKILFCSQKIYPGLKPHLGGIQDLLVLLVDSEEFAEAIKSYSAQIIEERTDSAPEKATAIFYTSGTTNLPKAVLLSQKNLLSNIQSIIKLNIVTPQDVVISLLPLCHTYPFMLTCLAPMLLGARISYPSGTNARDILICLRDTKVSIWAGVPQAFLHLDRLIKEEFIKMPFIARFLLDILIEIFWIIRKLFRINLSKFLLAELHQNFGGNLRLMLTGGARLEPKLTRDFFKWGFTLLEGYGLTEISPVVTLNPILAPKIGSVGKPLPGILIRIVSPDNIGAGEVAIRVPNAMLGYYNLPQETDKVIKEGWFFSDDLGYLDKDGYLYLTGRKDEVIVLGPDKKINPEEIEEHYTKCPFIKEICVFTPRGKAFLEGGGKLMALVVPDEDYLHRRQHVNIEETIRWELDNLSYRLNEYKRIKEFVISKEGLPRTQLGRIMRHKIQTKYLERLTPLREDAQALKKEDSILLSSDFSQKALGYLSGLLKRKINLDDHLELDLGLDSLGRIELLLGLQKLLEVEVPEELMMELFYANTIRDLFKKAMPLIPRETKEFKKGEFLWSKILEEPLSLNTLKIIRLKPLLTDKVITFLVFGFLQTLFTVFFALRIKGKSNLPLDGPCIIYANHSSYLDGPLIASCLPLRLAINTYFVGFKQIFLHPLLKNWVKKTRLVPIDTTFDSVRAMQACAYLLKHSKMLCYFPEGQRSSTGEIVNFKKGIGILAKELNVSLIPTYIDGSFRAWPRYRWLPYPAKIKVTFGKKLTNSDLLSDKIEIVKGDVYELLAESLRKELIKLKDKAD